MRMFVCAQELCRSLLECLHSSKVHTHGPHLNLTKKSRIRSVSCAKKGAPYIFILSLKQSKAMVTSALCNLSAVTSPRGHYSRTSPSTRALAVTAHWIKGVYPCLCVCKHWHVGVCNTIKICTDKGINSKLGLCDSLRHQSVRMRHHKFKGVCMCVRAQQHSAGRKTGSTAVGSRIGGADQSSGGWHYGRSAIVYSLATSSFWQGKVSMCACVCVDSLRQKRVRRYRVGKIGCVGERGTRQGLCVWLCTFFLAG